MSAPAGVVLRPADADDLAWLRGLAADAAVVPFLAVGAGDDLGLEAGDHGTGLLVVEAPDGERVGGVRVALVNRRSRIGAIRTLMIDPAARGRGLGAATLRALAGRFLDDGGLHRLEAEVYGFNEAALRAFDAAGFTREGVRRSAYDRHGAWQDGVLFGRLAGEPGTG